MGVWVGGVISQVCEPATGGSELLIGSWGLLFTGADESFSDRGIFVGEVALERGGPCGDCVKDGIAGLAGGSERLQW